MPLLTEEQFKAALPPQIRGKVNPALIKQVNQTLGNPEVSEQFKENLIGYASIMQDGRFKMTSYINAVKYVSFKLLGSTNIDAYSKTFPDKVLKFQQDGVSKKDQASYASAYNKTKLVNLIFEQTLVPTHVVNAPLFQKAINVQAELMMYAKSEKVRTDAAACLIKELKPPETKKIELDLGAKTDKTLDTLRESTLELVKQQKKMIEQGASAKTIAESALIVVGNEHEPQ